MAQPVVSDADKQRLIEVLKETGGNRALAAQRLGLRPATMYSRVCSMLRDPKWSALIPAAPTGATLLALPDVVVVDPPAKRIRDATPPPPPYVPPAPLTDTAPGRKHMFVPDIQARPHVPLQHMYWAGCYAAEKRPDVIVFGGDVYDLPSLSMHDEERPLLKEGRRYVDDIEAGDTALSLFMNGLATAGPEYKPRKVVTLGNHEMRIVHAVERDPRLEGQMGLDDLAFNHYGFEVVPFLQPIDIDGISYCHYFPVNAQGRVSNIRNGCPSASAQAKRVMRSCTAGHRQGLDVSIVSTPTGMVRGVIAGSFYQHDDDDWMSPQGRNFWRGVLIKHEVRGGWYGLMEVSLDYLRRRYGK